MMSDNYLELFIIVINCFPIFYKRYKVKISETNGNQYVRTSSLFTISTHTVHTTKTHNSFFHYSLVLIAIELKLSGSNLYVNYLWFLLYILYY